MHKPALLAAIFSVACSVAPAASVYTERIDDAQAVYLTKDSFDVHADGTSDDTAAIQSAINKVQETTNEGILFIPEGRYRITHTVYVWPGIRVIGYGAHRPVMVLADNTPGYQKGVADMFFYAGYRPGDMRSANTAAFPGTPGLRAFHGPETPPGPVPPTHTMPDANPGTFYSAMSNVDFEVGGGNEAAVAVRFHAAQHSFLAHMDFHMGSGLAGLNDVGNEAEDLHFYGGRYGILTRKPSPAWQFTLLDSTFEGQHDAAIRENEAGLTLVHDEFKNVPTAVEIDKGYSDELWIKDAQFQQIGGPAIIISNDDSRMTEINTEHIQCAGVPVFAQFRESGRKIAGRGPTYEVKVFSYGLTLATEGSLGSMQTKFNAVPLPALASMPNVIAAPPPVSEWTNLRQLGAKGDGKTDDTAAIRKAIAEHRVVYVPMGRYVVSDTITLRPDSVLIALHPDQTQFDLLDRTPGFEGPGTPKPILEAPKAGTNIVTGLGLFTNGINSRAVGALWMAGAHSLMDDVRFLGGHGTNGLNGNRLNPYNNAHTADPDIHRRWDAQYPSLWITHGGGGIFANIWTPDTFAQAGLYIEDTQTPGRVFELSSEHHVRNEIVLRDVANWELDALQTEEESGESPNAYSLEIDNSHNITIANWHGYRVVRSYQPFPYAARVSRSYDIRFRNAHVDNNSSIASCDEHGEDCRQLVRAGKVSYANAILNETTHTETRDREFAWLDISKRATPVPEDPNVHKLVAGFFNLSGGAVDANGNLFFADPHFQRIYEWNASTNQLTIVRDNPLDPVNLVFDNSGNLIVISSGGKTETAYSFRPGTPEDEMTVLDRERAQTGAKRIAMPVDFWVNGDFSNTLNTETYEYTTLDEMFRKKMTTAKPYQYVSPDKSLVIPANEVFVQGETYFGSKWSDILMATGLVTSKPGQTVYVTNEADEKTYSGKLNPDGTISGLKLFVTQGGESLAQDMAGNVYIAAGQVFVYNAAGKLQNVIRVPERPTELVFGGKDRHTLFILTHKSVYSVRASK